LHRLIAEAGSGPAKEFLLVKLGEKLIEEGRIAAATATLDSLEFMFPQPSFAERRVLLRKRLLEPRTLKIGVVLPLMRNYEAQGPKERDVGISLYEGIQLAFEEFRESGGASRPIVLEVKDTEREPARAAAVVKELCADPAVIGIIGPPFSGAAFAVAYHANTSRVPLLTPTANADGIAATGPYVFQANPDFTARAKAMARYAVQSLRLTRLGVLSPNEPNSRVMAQAFAAEAARLGAEVLPPEFYEPGSTNLGTQLISLRRRANDAGGEPFLLFGASLGKRETAQLARMGVAPRVLDSLVTTKAVVNAEQLLGEQARTLLDGAGIPYRAGDPHVDSIARPVTALHGLYCPIASPEEIGIVSSQVAYFNLQTKLLGSGEWNNERELNTHRRYCSGVVFESDSYTSPAEADYARFASRFVQRFGKRPNRNTLYGYDVATIVFQLLQRGALTREQLREALATMPSVQTLHGKVSFGTRRVNPWLHILEYTGTAVQRVGEVMTE
jgi:ABC-type branched-subunit amino acid transport system substrate-binding protein